MPVSVEIAIDLFIYLFAVYFSWRNLYLIRKNTTIVWVLALLFCLFAAWGGDYFHYQDHFVYVKTGADTHLEPPYIFIIKYLAPFYTAFRFFVWGSALWFFHKTCKKTPVPEYFILYVFIALSLTRFSYARASLAMAIMTYGGIIMSESTVKHPLHFIIGFVLVVASIYFHKSAAFGVAVMLAALFARNLMSKAFLLVIFVLFPVALVFVKEFLVDYMMVQEFEETMVNISSGLQKALLH